MAIGLSTLLCWQHHLVDVATGQLLGMVCLHLYPWVSPPQPEVSLQSCINARPSLGLAYLAGSGMLVGLAWLGWPAGFPLLWPAAALLVVAAAYLGAGPAFLGKLNGAYPRGSWWLLLPYRWLAGLSAGWLTAGRPAWVELEPGILLGRRLSAEEAERCPARAVLDLTAEYPEARPFLGRTYRGLAVLDMTSPSRAQLDEGLDFVRRHRSQGVYIHCSLGLGRTCAVAAAYLMAEGLSCDQALARVRAVQPRMALLPEVRLVLMGQLPGA